MMQSWVGLDLCFAFSVILNTDWMQALTHISNFVQLRSFFPSVSTRISTDAVVSLSQPRRDKVKIPVTVEFEDVQTQESQQFPDQNPNVLVPHYHYSPSRDTVIYRRSAHYVSRSVSRCSFTAGSACTCVSRVNSVLIDSPSNHLYRISIMSFRGGGGRGGGRGGGFNRGGDRGGGFRGGFGGGRGGFNRNQDYGPPEHVVVLGEFVHPCEDDIVCKCLTQDSKVPYFNAPVYLENKEQIGKVDEIFGQLRDFYFSVKLSENMKASSFKKLQKFYIDPYKLLPLQRFLPRPPGEKGPPGGGGRGGRGGRGGGFRGGRGGFGGRGGGRGGFGGRGGGFGGRGGGGGGFGGRGGGGGFRGGGRGFRGGR
ncbi:hypothetical protein QQF64_007181 [Cirrhinus molitorella]|uniref:H/ACA ribonucleoprotein complex subunit 1 n=1 Tax=Cirrhinus molitorella TaxID=172907 RepID=A0ABR3MC85_9TELE